MEVEVEVMVIDWGRKQRCGYLGQRYQNNPQGFALIPPLHYGRGRYEDETHSHPPLTSTLVYYLLCDSRGKDVSWNLLYSNMKEGVVAISCLQLTLPLISKGEMWVVEHLQHSYKSTPSQKIAIFKTKGFFFEILYCRWHVLKPKKKRGGGGGLMWPCECDTHGDYIEI